MEKHRDHLTPTVTSDERLWWASCCAETCCSLLGRCRKMRKKENHQSHFNRLDGKQKESLDMEPVFPSRFFCSIREHRCASVCRPSLETFHHHQWSSTHHSLRSALHRHRPLHHQRVVSQPPADCRPPPPPPSLSTSILLLCPFPPMSFSIFLLPPPLSSSVVLLSPPPSSSFFLHSPPLSSSFLPLSSPPSSL